MTPVVPAAASNKLPTLRTWLCLLHCHWVQQDVSGMQVALGLPEAEPSASLGPPWDPGAISAAHRFSISNVIQQLFPEGLLGTVPSVGAT